MELTIVKRDGSKEPYDENNLYRVLEKASRGLDDQITKVGGHFSTHKPSQT